MLDLPLFGLFALYLSTVLLLKVHELYLAPQIELMRWTPERADAEATYYHRHCTPADMTATDTSQLLIQPDMDVDDRVDHMLTHGVSVYPNLLSPETAAEVKAFIVKQNLLEENFWVIENENRYSFGIRVNQHPSVSKALREILHNPVLIPALEQIVGKNPAIIEFTAITSTPGATTQRYHQDVVPEGSAAKYARSFSPSYSLFIPLQNTTAAMGATDICPGSHMCADGALEYCDQTGFQVSGVDDNWPAGYGALLNQQTSHRGMAFTDENAVPERVLFILTFAPRPRFGPGELETRIPSTGGSYSLHWSQWGHTLAHFQKPDERMREPWKTLRSLGIYKGGREWGWGWDWISSTTMRAVNDEAGYSRDDLDHFLEQGGFKYIPQNLHGVVSDEEERGSAWFDFALDTLKRCESALKMAHLVGLGVYVGGVLVINGLLWAFGKRQGSELTIFKSLTRLFVAHVVLGGLAWLSFSVVSQTTWAENIRSGKLYQLPEQPRGENLQGTLPLDQDILVFDDYQSDYLGSYTRVHEVSHPGNKAWNEIISLHSTGYNMLSSSLQELLCTSITLWVRQAQRRVLAKNFENDWAELTEDQAKQFYHKGLLQRSDPFVREAVTQIDFLLSETKYGRWRDTSMHLGAIPLFLRRLQDKILHLPWVISKRSNGVSPGNIPRPRKMHGLPQPSLPSIPKRTHFSTKRRRMLPEEPPISEPYLGAWLKGGDVVEAKYQGLPGESSNSAVRNDYAWKRT